MISICGRSRSTPPALSPMAITAGALGGARLPHRKKDEDSSSASRQPGFLTQSQCGEHLWAEDRETISFGVVAETNSSPTVCLSARTDARWQGPRRVIRICGGLRDAHADVAFRQTTEVLEASVRWFVHRFVVFALLHVCYFLSV